MWNDQTKSMVCSTKKYLYIENFQGLNVQKDSLFRPAVKEDDIGRIVERPFTVKDIDEAGLEISKEEVFKGTILFLTTERSKATRVSLDLKEDLKQCEKNGESIQNIISALIEKTKKMKGSGKRGASQKLQEVIAAMNESQTQSEPKRKAVESMDSTCSSQKKTKCAKKSTKPKKSVTLVAQRLMMSKLSCNSASTSNPEVTTPDQPLQITAPDQQTQVTTQQTTQDTNPPQPMQDTIPPQPMQDTIPPQPMQDTIPPQPTQINTDLQQLTTEPEISFTQMLCDFDPPQVSTPIRSSHRPQSCNKCNENEVELNWCKSQINYLWQTIHHLQNQIRFQPMMQESCPSTGSWTEQNNHGNSSRFQPMMQENQGNSSTADEFPARLNDVEHEIWNNYTKEQLMCKCKRFVKKGEAGVGNCAKLLCRTMFTEQERENATVKTLDPTKLRKLHDILQELFPEIVILPSKVNRQLADIFKPSSRCKAKKND